MATSDNASPEQWESLDFAELSKRYAELTQSIRSQIDDLVALGPVLKRKAREYGLNIEADYSDLQGSLQRLTSGPREQRGGRPGRGGARRTREARSRPMRFQLQWRDTGEPVLDQQEQPIMFRSKVQILRGPKYEALLGDKVRGVQLIDTQQDNKVVVDSLSLGPAPGGRR